MGFSGQECWSGQPCPPPGGPPTPDVEPPFPVSPALQADFYHLSHVFHTFPLSPCFSHIILDFFSWGIFQLTNYLISYIWFRASLVAQTIRNLPAMQETGFDSWGRRIPWRREWQPTPVFFLEISWTEKPGGLQSMGSQRFRHDWAANTFTFISYLL